MGNKVVIEIDDGMNRAVLFPPCNEMLRGKFSRANMGAVQSNRVEFNQLPEIPGIYVFVDLDEKSAGYYDTLAFPKHRTTLEKASQFCKSICRGKYKAVTGKKFEKLTPDQLTTWLYVMWSFVKKAKVARLVHGEFPAIHGRAHTNPYDWTNKGQNQWSEVDTDEEEMNGYDLARTAEYEPATDPLAA